MRATFLKNLLSPWFAIGFVVITSHIHSLQRRNAEDDSIASHSQTDQLLRGIHVLVASPTKYIAFLKLLRLSYTFSFMKDH